MHELDLAEELIHTRCHGVYRHIARIDYPHGALVLIPGCGRHHEKDLDTVRRQTFGHSVAGCPQTSCDMWRELPSEHQHFHFFPSFLYLFIRLSIVRSAAVLHALAIAP